MSTTSFRNLHHGEVPLVLPNAWDVPSALVLREAGFPAIGTTSLGVAASHGVPDGRRSTEEHNLLLAAALRTLGCHLSFDVEDGYSDDPAAVAAYVAELSAAGNVAGVNVEDSTDETLVDPDTHVRKVAAIKQIVPDVFLNARVDTYWLGQDATIAHTVDRARRYRDAGADGIFVPGVTEPDVIRQLAAAIDRPLNVLAVPGSSLAALGELGVRRVSTGSLPYRAALQSAVAAAVAVRDGAAPPPAIEYGRLQTALAGHPEVSE